MAGILTFDAETFKWLNKAKSENKAQKLSEESFHVKEFCSRYKQQRKGKKYALFLRLKFHEANIWKVNIQATKWKIARTSVSTFAFRFTC